MRIAVMPGSFDPFTVGHADILKRAASLFDFVYVGVLVNKNKKGLLDYHERELLIKKTIADMSIKNADAECFDGLLIDFMKQKNASATIRGVRSIKDYVAEQEMADLNVRLYAGAETVCLFSRPEYGSISSSAIREILAFGGDVTGLVPCAINDYLKERMMNHG